MVAATAMTKRIRDVDVELIEKTKNLPFDYESFLHDLLKKTFKALSIDEHLTPLNINPHSPRLISDLGERIFEYIKQKTQTTQTGFKQGDIFTITQAQGLSLDELVSQTYFYGGTDQDVPIGSQGRLTNCESTQRFMLRIGNNGDSNEWQFHPSEITYTGRNVFSALINQSDEKIKTTLFNAICQAEREILPGYIGQAKKIMKKREAQKKHFIKLPSLRLRKLAAFSILPQVYERDLTKKGRADISELRYGGNITPEQLLNGQALVFHPHKDRFDIDFLKYYADNNFPCAMQIADLKELDTHIQQIYQIAHAYYVFAKKNVRNYPINNCTVGAKGVFQSLLKHGYVNAATSWDRVHSFDLLPFVFGTEKTEGVILLDPTSSQLWTGRRNNPRNVMVVMVGSRDEWEYNPRSYNYFRKPYSIVGYSVISKNGSKVTLDLRTEIIDRFYEKAFKNPIRLLI